MFNWISNLFRSIGDLFSCFSSEISTSSSAKMVTSKNAKGVVDGYLYKHKDKETSPCFYNFVFQENGKTVYQECDGKVIVGTPEDKKRAEDFEKGVRTNLDKTFKEYGFEVY